VTLRVLQLLESLDYSGAGRQVALLAAGLPRDEFEVHVAGLGIHGPMAGELAAAGAHVTSLDRRRVIDVPALWRLKRLARRIQPHIIHSWDSAAHAYASLAAGARYHLASERRAELGKSWAEECIDRWALRRAAGVVCSCQTVHAFQLLRLGLEHSQRCVVIPQGVAAPPEPNRAGLLSELGLSDDAILVAGVGPLTHVSRIADMLMGVEILGALFPLHLLVVGDGPQRRSLEQWMACLRRTSLAHFLGCRDARQILPHVDLLWHTSAEDSVPSAVLEAMAGGLPVVACDTPALRELMTPEKTGLLFPLGDRPGLARCTQRLLQDRALAQRIGQAAREHVLQSFSAEAMVDRHAALYREIADVGVQASACPPGAKAG
jgi:glycosyltransferase involved in cell wall biosynthesis